MTYDDWKTTEPDMWDDGCLDCDNTGEILVCPDDMCHGTGECIHKDGYITCPRCKGASA